MANSPVDDNHAPSPAYKKLSEHLAAQTPMPARCENNDVPANSEHSILFASYLHDDITESDQQPSINASLIDIVNLESDLAATQLIVEEHELEIEKLKSDNSALKSALELLKTDTNQKAKLKTMMQGNDSLKPDLSKHHGIQRYTISSTSDEQVNQAQLEKLRDELSVTQAKLASLQDVVWANATSLIDLTDANAKSGNVLATAYIQIACGDAKNGNFHVVMRPGPRQHGDVSTTIDKMTMTWVSDTTNNQILSISRSCIQWTRLDKTHINDHGNHLLELYKSTGLVIFNGRLSADKGTGEFTRVDTTGCSVIDYRYFVWSPALFDIVSNLCV